MILWQNNMCIFAKNRDKGRVRGQNFVMSSTDEDPYRERNVKFWLLDLPDYKNWLKRHLRVSGVRNKLRYFLKTSHFLSFMSWKINEIKICIYISFQIHHAQWGTGWGSIDNPDPIRRRDHGSLCHSVERNSLSANSSKRFLVLPLQLFKVWIVVV